MTDSNVLVPLKLDAFVFNEAVCSGGEKDAKIAPITQPNYTFLRLDNSVVQNDTLNHVDLHHTTPARFNSRYTDLGTGETRQKRVGVYLHWMMPRTYRTGAAATDSVKDKDGQQRRRGLGRDADDSLADESAPNFRPVPARWLVIRHINDIAKIKPEGAPVPEVQAWVIESDRRRSINELDQDVDLQVDVSPFIYPSKVEKISIEQQAEVFIGFKKDAKDWKEDPTANRVPLSLLNSANHLFADYQPHNSNVFSMVDNFEYRVAGDSKPRYLTEASASYYVIGWHTKAEEDLFFIPNTGDKPTRSVRLDACTMEFTKKGAAGMDDWSKSTNSARLLCHGAMYDVQWNAGKKPDKRPADTYSNHLNTTMPVGVGTTPLDSILAYIQAHVGTETGDLKELQESILCIQSLLTAQDDGVEAQREAVDMLYNNNFDRADCGTHFFFSESDTDPNSKSKPINPTKEDKDKLAALNRVQFALDLTSRTVTKLRWEMFSWWWKFVSDNDLVNNLHLYKDNANNLTLRLKNLITSMIKLKGDVKARKSDLPLAKPGVLPNVYQQRDPTLLVGGVQSGWAHDYLKKLGVRLDTQTITGDDNAAPPKDWDKLLDIVAKLPQPLVPSAKSLVKEFLLLRPEGPVKELKDKNQSFPLFHDQGWNPDGLKDAPWRDRWENTQPWFPLFLEWEVEYTHIPYKYWSLEERTSKESAAAKLRYGIREDITLSSQSDMDDQRTLSGRVLILPQPSFSLQAKIDQLFSNTPKDILDEYLPEAQRTKLEDQLYKLAFLSSPLAGLTDHLLTLVQGTHIKPTKRPPGQKPQPLEAAIDKGRIAGFDVEQLMLIDKESDLTPYGTLVSFLAEKYSPFKPVTHGQFRFTKLNIIDRFGQAIHAIDPTPTKNGPPKLFPCISEFYECQILKGTTNVPNTVEKSDPGLCEFIQLPPSINQYARLNSVFVTHDEGDNKAYWRPTTEWENPIWGWIVINYAEYGIQIFLPDGTFYREVRFGGPTGVSSSPAWLPFAPPTGATNTSQLDNLLAKLADTVYLQAFVDMINKSLLNAPPAPSAYAQFLNSVVGKPLALVNMGWSLELQLNAYVNQSSLVKKDPELWLLPGIVDRKLYDFHVKLGDKSRSYDGLVGYFNALPKPKPGNELELGDLYTYFTPEGNTVPSEDANKYPLRMIDNGNYPTFNPFWITPEDRDPTKAATPEAIEKTWNSKLTVFGAIVDPFTPMHGYSSFMPIQTLKLPPWTWQEAMNKMTAFFHMGPIIITEDVPKYDPDYKLKSGYNLMDNHDLPGSKVAIPALGLADWNWLQPYIDKDDPIAPDGRLFSSLALGKLDNRPRFEGAPYTAIEGYLQLKKPIVRQD